MAKSTGWMPALEPYKAVIDGILRADLDAPRKRVVSDGQALCR
ncbi:MULTISPECIES: hypothetical protein [Streptomyces]|uniref:Uncharacterized protein n=1 Tax=Streptomyces lienomycini TaxID=284035 RepID=A0ABV9X6W2_9ACTN